MIRVGNDPRSLSPTVQGDPPLPSPRHLHQSMSSPLLGKGTDLISSSPSCREGEEVTQFGAPAGAQGSALGIVRAPWKDALNWEW